MVRIRVNDHWFGGAVQIEPLGTELIERYLDSQGLRFFRGRDGNEFLVLFTSTPLPQDDSARSRLVRRSDVSWISLRRVHLFGTAPSR